MSVILNIDTSIETASVSIAKDGIVLAAKSNSIQKDHASFLHTSLKQILSDLLMDMKQVDAVAVTNGPGSYTGLRVGMASAKGLSYALGKPFITIGTLNALAAASIATVNEPSLNETLFCPMIDARRLEVYTALFDHEMTEIMPPTAVILNENSFENILAKNKTLFFGSGSAKWRDMVSSVNAAFINTPDITTSICELSYNKFMQKDFTDLTYSEPAYIKDFFNP